MHYPELTPERIANLEKLASYLEGLPADYAHFDMVSFIDRFGVLSEQEKVEYALSSDDISKYHCGTVACAIGHGPAAGIPVHKSYIDRDNYIDWGRYSDQFAPDGGILWDWMFAGSWEDFDNSHFGAAARIRFLLAGNKIPEEFVIVLDDGEEELKFPNMWDYANWGDDPEYIAACERLRAVYADYRVDADVAA